MHCERRTIQRHRVSVASRYVAHSCVALLVPVSRPIACAVILSSSAVWLVEGSPGVSDSYTVVLDEEPTADVTISINVAPELGNRLAIVPASRQLTFTRANWRTAQAVTVSAVNDNYANSTATGAIYHSISSSDDSYNVFGWFVPTSNITVDVTDDDVARVTLSETSLSAVEGESASYTVVLASQPDEGPVSVAIAVIGSSSQVTLSAETLTFTH